MSTAPVPAPAKKSNVLWWILGIAGAFVVLCVVAGVFIAGLVLQNFRVHKSGQEVQVSTPVGELKVSQTAARQTGLPVYPGAVRIESGKNVQLTLPADQRVGLIVVQYHSSDSLDRVDAWYRGHLGPEFKREEGSGGHVNITIKGADRVNLSQDEIAFVYDHESTVRVVALARRDGGTQITQVQAGAQETQ
jgi:hypothetical protein